MNRNNLHRLRAAKLIEQHWQDLCDVDHGAWSEQWGDGSELTKLYLAYREACFECDLDFKHKGAPTRAKHTS